LSPVRETSKLQKPALTNSRIGLSEARVPSRQPPCLIRQERRHEVAMSIGGVITRKDVLKHGATIVREFGAATYLRCCLALLRGARITFLDIVFAR